MAKVTSNSNSSPVTEPLPPVVWSGLGWMPPGCTELLAVKRPRSVVVKARPLAELRLSRATSDGELSRVGTFGVWNGGVVPAPVVRPTSERAGKTR